MWGCCLVITKYNYNTQTCTATFSNHNTDNFKLNGTSKKVHMQHRWFESMFISIHGSVFRTWKRIATVFNNFCYNIPNPNLLAIEVSTSVCIICFCVIFGWFSCFVIDKLCSFAMAMLPVRIHNRLVCFRFRCYSLWFKNGGHLMWFCYCCQQLSFNLIIQFVIGS